MPPSSQLHIFEVPILSARGTGPVDLLVMDEKDDNSSNEDKSNDTQSSQEDITPLTFSGKAKYVPYEGMGRFN
jgi:hypothetical protein